MSHSADLAAATATASPADSAPPEQEIFQQFAEKAPSERAPAACKIGRSGNAREKNRFLHRLVGKLQRTESVASSHDLAGKLAETQYGNEKSPTMTFTYPPGSQPLPRYTIRRGIGAGGFGEVYFAVNDAGKEVALKRIQRNLEIELRGAAHCLNLKHPNLVSLYDICRDADDQSWVVMEFVAGKNLRQILDLAPHGLPTDEVDRWFTAIAAGVSHLHSAGLVHRDLKPGNVFDDLGIVKVGDYGLSKFISASHRGGHTESVGTFHYMAPEIGRGQYGREIDIYALGIMLYELLTGRVPFDGESSHEIIVKHLTAIPDLKDIPQPYRTVVAKCLEKDPARRYRTVAEMMGDLQANGNVRQQTRHQREVPPRLQPQSLPQSRLQSHGTTIDEPILAQRVANRAPEPPEPLATAIQRSYADFQLWWRSLDRSPVTKAVVVVAVGFVLVLNTHWLILALTLIGIFYVPYYVLRQMVLHARQQPSYAQAQRIANTAVVTRPIRPPSRRQWCQQMRSGLRAKGSLVRAAELNTSWIAATMTVVGLALAAGVIGLRNGPVNAVSIAPYVWMGTVVLISSLSILGLGKLWERGDGEGLPRRFVLAGLGAGIGATAFALNRYLMLPLSEVVRDIDSTDLPPALYQGQIPLAGAMMAHFALLFSVLRWWKLVDPLRRRRLSLWSVAVAVGAAWAVHQLLPIPQPAGLMIAAGIAVTIQMSAPWISRETAATPTGFQPQPTTPASDAAPAPISAPSARGLA